MNKGIFGGSLLFHIFAWNEVQISGQFLKSLVFEGWIFNDIVSQGLYMKYFNLSTKWSQRRKLIL